MIDAIYNFGLNLLAQGWWTGVAWPVIWNLIKIVVVLLPAETVSDSSPSRTVTARAPVTSIVCWPAISTL